MVNETTLEITSGGKDVTKSILPFFKSLTLTDKKGIESDSCLLAISDPALVLGEPESLVELSFTVNGIDKGIFEINEISGDIKTGDLEISGTALLTKGNLKIARSRSFEPLTIKALVTQIANEHGYDPIIGADIADISLSHINQVKESDLNLLTRIAEDYDATFKISHKRFVFIGADTGKNANGDDLPVMPINDPEITVGRWAAKKREKVGGVKVGWLNEATNQMDYETIGSSPYKEINRQMKNKSEAANLAKSEFNKLEKMDRSLSINIPLEVLYVAGCKANISNHGSINGEWLIESFVHTITLDSFDSTSITLAKSDQ